MKKINDWGTQLKMSFNLNPTKQAQEVFFSRKIKKTLYTLLNFHNTNVKQNVFQKHLGLILESQFSFEEHLKITFNKVNETVKIIRKLRNSLPSPSQLTLYKSFIRPHLGYGDIISISLFQNKIESIQYNACLTINDVIKERLKKNFMTNSAL